MKKIEMLLFLILIVFFASSQSIVDTTKRWNNYIQFPSSYPVEERTELVLFSQDTMIDSKIYKKVLRTTDELMINWEEYCYIRETIDKKVYIRSDTSSQEYLLYDMDVNINDTLLVTGIQGFNQIWDFYSTYMVVDSIDSVLIGNNYRQRTNLHPLWGGHEEWIEGIGSISGILHNSFGLIGGNYFELLCYYENDTLTYQNNSYSSCYIFYTSISNNEIEIYVKISPNPINHNLYYQFSKPPENTVVSILNLNGQVLFSKQISEESGIINLMYYPKGIYIFKVSNERINMTKKIVIN